MNRLLACLVAAACLPTASLAADKVVNIVNRTSQSLIEFYGSNVGTDDWEEDILGEEVLVAGADVEIDFDDGSGGCFFDFKAVFESGEVVYGEKVNVCEVAEYKFAD